MTDQMYQLLPPLSRAEYDALCADIEANGVQAPVVVDKATGEILDGHHRAEIAARLGRDFPWVEHECGSPAEGRAYALRANLNRRNMSPEQRTALRDVQIQVAGELRAEGKTQEQIGAMLGVAHHTVSRWLDTSIVPPDKASIDLRTAIPRTLRDAIYERITEGETQTQVAADYAISQQRVSQIVRQVEAKRNTPQPVVDGIDFPAGPFSCVVIDPPWPVQKIEREARPDQGQSLDYPTMKVDCGADAHDTHPLCCIRAIPMRALADVRGSHIYLWVTHKFLPDGFNLFEAWGVRYQCLMTWRKNVGPTPFTWMYDTEHVLFGRVGSLDLNRNGLRLSFDAPAQGHSIKPDVFYDRVREASPGPRLDMFPGVEHNGFEPWGLEASHRGNV